MYQIAIIGSGPAGLSAAARAAEYDLTARQNDPGHQPTHILLEGFDLHAKTIQRYQKGKYVMAEPNFLDLRSPIRFREGTRESILGAWAKGLDEKQVNVRFGAEVTGISGEQGNFQLSLKDGSQIGAEFVVLCIGTEGNPRKIGVPGQDCSLVQYQLDDPDEYSDESIVVIGAGDAAIENALGLSRQNKVHIVNRRAEFARAKEGNLSAVLAAINDPNLEFSCYYETNVKAVEAPTSGDGLGAIVLETPDGEQRVPCHRIIARLGSIPPRAFLEKCGVAFPDKRPAALPELSAQYESNVKGLYIIGALGGYPLIKQAMNQGYEVVEYIRGNNIKAVDYELLRLQFAGLPYMVDAEDVLDLYRQRLPMFRRMNPLAFRELILESRVIASVPDAVSRLAAQGRADAVADELLRQKQQQHQNNLAELEAAGEQITDADRKPPQHRDPTHLVTQGDHVYRDGEYTNSFYTIAEGEVTLQYEKDGPTYTLTAGQFFGEMSLISGRPRSGSAIIGAETILIETPRRMMLKLMNSNDEVRDGIEWVFTGRALQQHFAPHLPVSDLRDIARNTVLNRYAVGDVIYKQGEHGDCLHLIRSGTVILTKDQHGQPLVVDHQQSGQMFGQLALMGDPIRRESVRAAVKTETIAIKSHEFLALLKRDPERVDDLQQDTSEQLKMASTLESMPEGGSIISFLMDEGLGEATNAMVIDEDLCVGCDNCEKACAATHNGVSRLDRNSGVSFASIQVPISCRHCEHPHCMKDCPPDAIHRTASGEVFIDDTCIGCGNCVTNCPYDAIHMAPRELESSGFLSWLLFGVGRAPGEKVSDDQFAAAKAHGYKAVKCDGCMDLSGGPACVRACPTGAATRLSPAQFPDLIKGR